MRSHLLKATFCTGLLGLAACSNEVITSCAPVGQVKPFCGAIMPEDLEPLEEMGGMIVSEYGDGGNTTGRILWFEPASSEAFQTMVDGATIERDATGEDWGMQDCTAPPTLSPHGIHLSQRDQRWQLLVVNHSEQEQILMYEVLAGQQDNATPTLAWRGCVSFPEYAVLNDVAALPDGGFAVTHMYDRGGQTWSELSSMLGLNNGHVWRWRPGLEPTVIANSSARMPNGIEVSGDGKTLWVNNYLQQELRAYDVATEAITARIEVPNIDNSAWLSDGRLLLASHLSPLTMGSCFGLERGSCGSPYQLVAVDITAGTSETIYTSFDGEPFGPATVAVEYEGAIYAGSFSGDRLVRIDGILDTSTENRRD